MVRRVRPTSGPTGFHLLKKGLSTLAIFHFSGAATWRMGMLLVLLSGNPIWRAEARGPKKHLKRVAAPKHWMLDKLTGVFAPRPSTGPHKLRECLPLIVFLRNRLKYALTGDEVKKICMQRFIKIDGKVRVDVTYPAGFMDVISIEKTGEHFRLVYDTKGRFAVHRITAEEAKYKLCKVRKITVGTKGIPHLVTHDARTIRYPDPVIKVNDTVRIDLGTGKITSFIKFDTG
ncbi:40S ribosomal protein S4, Y isoform X4 [Papio anubis]|nr:40S ribosomal protein S4, Y isoform X4 [Papio anubis]